MVKKRASKAAQKMSSRTSFKLCSNCGAECSNDASKCEACGKTRFEPEWVKAHRPINRQFGVQITRPNPKYGEDHDRITLSKWWPGGHATFHLPTMEQWREVARIVDEDLGPRLGWTAQRLAKTAVDKGRSIQELGDARKLLSDPQKFIRQLVSEVDPDKFSKRDFDSFVETLGNIADVFTNANAGFREAFLAVVSKLPKQRQRALEDLNLLLHGWSLNVITNVAQQVKARLDTIALFEERIGDPRVFEIRGEDSIHRILERAMWLVDEHYWLLHSNKSLRVSIGKDMAKRDRVKFGKKRPDFVCGTVGDRLIILELKRPGRKLKIEDLNQLETYLTVAEGHFDFKSGRGYLVGSSVDDELKRHLKYRSNFEVLLYANILDGTKKRYHEFLKTIEQTEE